jgi:hypothetical protein
MVVVAVDQLAVQVIPNLLRHRVSRLHADDEADAATPALADVVVDHAADGRLQRGRAAGIELPPRKCCNCSMEIEKLKYKIVMDDGPDTVVLARLADLDLGAAAFMAATLKYPKRNVQLRQGARIIKRHGDEPKPEPSALDPRLSDWNASLIRGAKLAFKGTIMARDEASAIKQAIAQFNLTADQARRLVVSLRR